ncbi:MAG: methionine biosynthesis protein MetW, partial [Bryobacteraceae bacterium]
YDSPNIHFLTVHDFEDLTARQGWVIERSIYLAGSRKIAIFPNLTAETAVFLVRK